MEYWACFTRLADTNFTLPAASLIALWLTAAREWRLLGWWITLFGGGLFFVTASKVAYVGWGIGIAAIDFRGFSGHAMRAAIVAPPIAYLVTQKFSAPVRRMALVAGMLFAVMIGISRLVLHVHAVSEVISGLLLGLFLAYIFILLCDRRGTPVPYGRRYLLIGIACMLPLLLTRPAPTQDWIENVAIQLAGQEKMHEIRARMGKAPLSQEP